MGGGVPIPRFAHPYGGMPFRRTSESKGDTAKLYL